MSGPTITQIKAGLAAAFLWGTVIGAGGTAILAKKAHQTSIQKIKAEQAALAHGREWQTIPDPEIRIEGINPMGRATAIIFSHWVRSIHWEAYRRRSPQDSSRENQPTTH